MTSVKQVILQRRPTDTLKQEDFRVREVMLPSLADGQFLIRNDFLSLDAGFRQWMNAGASDNYLQEMPLGEPVQSIILGQVVESRHHDYPKDTWVMGRTSWESYSIADGSDLMTVINVDHDIPLHHYLAALGPSGMTAYFGLLRIGKPKMGDVLLVNAAGGGVGSLVGQIGKIMGCTTIGISSSESKCQWLERELKYDFSINHRGNSPVAHKISQLAPEGIDIYFDNVGGELLDQGLEHLALNARVVLCGAVSQYEKSDGHTGITNLWQLVTKRARAEGFMFSDYIEDYPAAINKLTQWIKEGKLTSPAQIFDGIENTAQAFCNMLTGKTQGKCLVKL